MPSRAPTFHRLSRVDYREALRWYGRISQGLAHRVESAVAETIGSITETPDAGTFFRDVYRWKKTRGFPYLVFYELDSEGGTNVFAIAHERRRPGYWLRRTRK